MGGFFIIYAQKRLPESSLPHTNIQLYYSTYSAGASTEVSSFGAAFLELRRVVLALAGF